MSMDKGAALNKRVWTLFEKAGFDTQPNSQSPAEHEVQLSAQKRIPVDLYATDTPLKVSIIASNKSGRLDRWTEHVNNYKELGRKAKADKVLFIVTGTEIDEKERQHLASEGVALWTEEELSYYEAVAEAIKGYAKYEIIHGLGLHTHEERDTHRVLAIRLRQPTSGSDRELFLFTLPPERLLKTCVIYRRAQGSADAYQRMLRKGRLPSIRKFVSRSDSLLPTDLIVHLAEKVTADMLKGDQFRDANDRPVTLSQTERYDLVALNIPMEYASLELIDGQHRLYGFVDTDAATKREFNLVVLGIKGLDTRQRRDAFVAINDNSRRMDPNLVSFLKYTRDDAECQRDNELMAIRIVVDLNRTTPFKRAIRLLDRAGKERVTLKGFSGYDLRGLLGPKGLLRRHYPNNTPEEYTQALRLYFSTLRSLFRKQWDNPEKYIIATNRGISAFLKLLKSLLKTHRGPLTEDVIKKYLSPLQRGWKTWEYEKLKETFVGSQGWKEFHRKLVAIIRRTHRDFKE
jgi:DNA sulfur modification protein DndB